MFSSRTLTDRIPQHMHEAANELLDDIAKYGSVTPSRPTHHAAIRHLLLNKMVVQTGKSYSFTAAAGVEL